MRALWIACFLLATGTAWGQSAFLKDAVAKLDKALLTNDTVTLKQLLHKDLTYGHSNGWVQTKEEVVGDLASGKLTYTHIEHADTRWRMANDVVTLRSTANVTYRLEGKPGELKLHVLQVWLKTNGRWKLLTRQSTKL